VLSYDDVRRSDNPEAAILGFLQSTYEARATLAHWDRSALEQPEPDVGRNLGAKAGTPTDEPKPTT